MHLIVVDVGEGDMGTDNSGGIIRKLPESIAIAVLYYLCARLGRMAAPPPGIAAIFWPPSGLALAALLIRGNAVWPGVWLGAFLANDWAALHGATPGQIGQFLIGGIGIDTGSLLQALLGATLFRRFCGDNPFENSRGTFRFVCIALSIGIVGSTCGVLSLCLQGYLPWGAAFDRWWSWWMGDAGGVLVVTPLLIVWWRRGWPSWDRARWWEAISLFLAAVALAATIFLWWHPSGESRYPADLLFVPFVAWIAYRFSQREVTLVSLVIIAIALWGTILGRGPYGGHAAWTTLPVAAAFAGLLSILSISVGSVITERKNATLALLTSEHWLRESQRISRIGSYVFDLRSGQWTSSEILDDIFGISPDSPRTREAWNALLHADDRLSVQEYLEKEVVVPCRDFSREYRIVRPADGEVRWVFCRGELAFDSNGIPLRMAGTILDVTERRNMESQLLQAQKMESIGRLAGGVAHDFNNLLTVINGYSDMVLRRLDPKDPLHDRVAQICDAGERAAELTKQLLAFSRKQVLQLKVLDLNQVVRNSETMLRRIIGEDVELLCVLDPLLCAVEADSGQLHQVIVNLAVNARDAMPDGGTLTIETRNGRSGELPGDVTLMVHDTGHGMDSATVERIFEPFFTTKGVGKGTGLGLATVYGIVRQSGGTISVRSQPGHGATFTIHLPATSRAPSESARTATRRDS